MGRPDRSPLAAVIIKDGKLVTEVADGWAVVADWNGFKKAKMTLMQHKSGFRSNPVKKVFAYINTGIQPQNVGIRDYENINGAILAYLWPRLVDPYHGGSAPNYFTAIVQLPGGYIAVGQRLPLR